MENNLLEELLDNGILHATKAPRFWMVLFYLAHRTTFMHHNDDPRSCCISHERMAQQLNLSQKSASSATLALERMGFIRRKKVTDTLYHFRINDLALLRQARDRQEKGVA